MKLKRWIIIAMFSALLTISVYLFPPLLIPLIQVPLTLQLFMVVLIGYLLKPMDAFLSVLIYVFLGFIGLPVFSGGQSGLQAIIGPSGGFILMFPWVSLLIAMFKSKKQQLSVNIGVGVLFAIILLYGVSAIWLSYVLSIKYLQSITGLFIFIIPDLLKIILASLIARRIQPLIALE